MVEVMTCPLCGGSAQEVKAITVAHLVVSGLAKEVHEGMYGICLNEMCDVVYFDPETTTVFNERDITVPIWYKRDADPKYICYCGKVTEERIVEAVCTDGAKSIEDIIRLTGAMKNGKCETNNPLGKCCGTLIKKTITRALDMI